jgi:hypothetical protein
MTERQRAYSRIIDAQAAITRAEKAAEESRNAMSRAIDELADAIDAYTKITERAFA